MGTVFTLLTGTDAALGATSAADATTTAGLGLAGGESIGAASACAVVATAAGVGAIGARGADDAMVEGFAAVVQGSAAGDALSERAALAGLGSRAVALGVAGAFGGSLSKCAQNRPAVARCFATKLQMFGDSTTMTSAIKAARNIAKSKGKNTAMPPPPRNAIRALSAGQGSGTGGSGIMAGASEGEYSEPGLSVDTTVTKSEPSAIRRDCLAVCCLKTFSTSRAHFGA